MAILAAVIALLMPAPEDQRYASLPAANPSTYPADPNPAGAVHHDESPVQKSPRERRIDARHKGCNTRSCDRRMDRKVRRRASARKWRFVHPYNDWLNRTAACESGGRWFIATGNGFYGGLQFTLSSWQAVGGSGYPHQNSILEQKYRGVKLLHLQGRGAWPVCG